MPFTQRKKLLERNKVKKKNKKDAVPNSDIVAGSLVSQFLLFHISHGCLVSESAIYLIVLDW